MNVHYIRIHTAVDSSPCQMEEVLVARIAPEKASLRLCAMNSKYPLPERLSHVKRIWRRHGGRGASDEIELLLLLSPIDHSDFCEQDWNKVVVTELGDAVIGPLCTMAVPRRMPLSRREYEEWRQKGVWPTAFHEDKSRMREETEELDLVKALGVRVIPTLLATPTSKCIIVDPQRCEAKDWVEGQQDERNVLMEPVMSTVAQIATKHCQSEQAGSAKRKSTSSTPYLCTGLFAFCSDEPSVMSAMALVHSRIRSVVFLRADPLRGGVLSRLRLQDIRETNHHFSVFQAIPQID